MERKPIANREQELEEGRGAGGVCAQQHRRAARDSGRAVGWGVVCPANTAHTARELAAQLRDSGAKALVTSEELLGTARAAAAEVGMPLERVILVGEGKNTGVVNQRGLANKGAVLDIEKAGADPEKDTAVIVHSPVCGLSSCG